MTKKNSAPQKSLALRFAERLPERIKHLDAIYQLVSSNNAEPTHLNNLKSQVLQLKGMAHASGLNEIEVELKNFLQLMNEALESNSVSILTENLHSLIIRLNEFINKPLVDLHHYAEETPHQIYLGMNDYHAVRETAEQLKYFGCYCHMFNDIDKLLDPKHQPRPDLVLLDTELCKQNDAEQLQALAKTTPIIFFTRKDSVKTRLFALRAGGKAFFTYPFEFSGLIEKIDTLITKDAAPIPYRVLIVEDSKTQALVTKEQLESDKMITKILSHPLEINETLIDFQPDVILLDLYMPDCSGSELARIIRQQENFVSIPIVFLSSEADRTKQLDALSLGGDDFLTKPIRKEHLISSVKSRAARSRALKAEMIQDSLTGLLNHTRVLEQLELEIARASRENEDLSFVMIDIDHFKAVNDQYGHPIGDRVIRSLARLLKQRLRKSDSIGRYGGEEFAVILPKTDPKMAGVLINEIRESFSKIQHKSNSDELPEFTCTFSAGVAHITEKLNSVDSLCQAADKALYAAKHSGRNCVVLESSFKQKLP